MLSQTTSSIQKKFLKEGEKPIENQAVLPNLVGYALVLLLGESWQDFLHICGKFIPKGLHGVALVNYSERGHNSIVQWRTFVL